MSKSHRQSPVMSGTKSTKPAEGLEEVVTEGHAADTYEVKDLAFDPMLDLNLPKSYEEVVSRFNRLQNGRNTGSMN